MRARAHSAHTHLPLARSLRLLARTRNAAGGSTWRRGRVFRRRLMETAERSLALSPAWSPVVGRRPPASPPLPPSRRGVHCVYIRPRSAVAAVAVVVGRRLVTRAASDGRSARLRRLLPLPSRLPPSLPPPPLLPLLPPPPPLSPSLPPPPLSPPLPSASSTSAASSIGKSAAAGAVAVAAAGH